MNTIPLHNIPGLDRPFAEMHDIVLAMQKLQTEQQIQDTRTQALCDATAFETLYNLQRILVFLNEEALVRQHTLVAA